MDELTDKQLQVHLQNKNESFSAMRAYHQSEIDHKKDAVDILKSILTASILVYGALFGLLLKEEISITIVQIAGLSTIFINSYIAFNIVLKTNKKIREDNIQYCLHFFEYRKEREILNLDEDLSKKGFESKSFYYSKKNKENLSHEDCNNICKKLSEDTSLLSGHNHTQNILINFAYMILIICCTGFIGLLLLGYKEGIIGLLIKLISL